MQYSPINVLLIEDDPGDTDFIKEILLEVTDHTFRLECVDWLKKGLKRLTEGNIDVVLLDLFLPDSHGLDTLARVNAKAPSVPIIVLTGLEGETPALKAVQAGAQDYLIKDSVDSNLIIRSMRYAIERKRVEEELRQSLAKLRRIMGGIIQAMTMTVETRDPYTAGHQRRVACLSRAIAGEMYLPKNQVDGIRISGAIHDIGKISIPTDILCKRGQLTKSQFELIKTHPQVGYDILKTIEFPWPIAQAVLQHQERFNGSGYPAGLAGKEIFLEARVLAVADVVEAMTFQRPYRAALGIDKALEEITDNKGKLYDPDVVEACLNLFRSEKFKFE